MSRGHPDKVADQISDAILDFFLGGDPDARVACETLVTTQHVTIAGEIRVNFQWFPHEIEALVRDTIQNIGYDQDGFSYRDCEIVNRLHAQSVDIAQGVDKAADTGEEGAGDQGLMFGYACDETPALMPAPIYYAHRILQELDKLRETTSEGIKFLRPDAKSQLTFVYDAEGKPVKIDTIVVSTQHAENAKVEDVYSLVIKAISAALPKDLYETFVADMVAKEAKLFVNPTGRFVIGGPDGDTGLTGRKIIVDTYGGAAPHGGGAFSGKDPTKVDRSAAYIARYLAKNVVAAGLAEQCTIQVAYAIGIAQPVSVSVDLHGAASPKFQAEIAAKLKELVDLSPRGIRTRLGLNKPIYKDSAAYGHFGRTPTDFGHFSWERTDLADELAKLLD